MEKSNKITSILKKIYPYIKDNNALIIAMISAVIVLGTGYINFCDYVTNNYIFLKYGLNYSFYVQDSSTLIFDFVRALIFFGTGTVIYTCFLNVFKFLKKENKYNIKSDLCIILIANIFITLMFNIKNLVINYIAILIFEILIIVALLLVTCIKRKINKVGKSIVGNVSKNHDLKYELIIFAKKMLILSFAWLLLTCISTELSIQFNKSYKIISSSNNSDYCKVIIYENKDYYLTLKCRIVDDNFIIYKGTQEKITSENTETYTLTFKEVILKEIDVDDIIKNHYRTQKTDQ